VDPEGNGQTLLQLRKSLNQHHQPRKWGPAWRAAVGKETLIIFMYELE